MDRALYASATGMTAQQHNLDVIADNLANADVAGFKGNAATFEALSAPGERNLGTVASGDRPIFTQGKLARSNGPFDIAIDGPGFFVLRDAQGKRCYTRAGEFSRAGDGTLRSATGLRLEGPRIPSDALSATVADDGTLSVTTANGTSKIGRIRLAEFAAPEHLRAAAGTSFAATEESGPPHLIDPGGDGPHLRFGMLEQSNVSIIESMMQILSAQRAYEANAKGVQAADEMMRIGPNFVIHDFVWITS